MINKDLISLVYSYVPDRIEAIKNEINNLTYRNEKYIRQVGNVDIPDLERSILHNQKRFELYQKELDLLTQLSDFYSENSLI